MMPALSPKMIPYIRVFTKIMKYTTAERIFGNIEIETIFPEISTIVGLKSAVSKRLDGSKNNWLWKTGR